MCSKLWNIRWNEQKLEHYGILVDLVETWELVHFNETYLKPSLSLQRHWMLRNFLVFLQLPLHKATEDWLYWPCLHHNHMEYSEQEYVVHVIYGHAASIISRNFCKLDQTHLQDHEIFWTWSDHHVYKTTNFSWQEQFRISGTKKFHKFLHDRCWVRCPPITLKVLKFELAIKGKVITWWIACLCAGPWYLLTFATYSISSTFSPFSLLTNLFVHKYLIFISLQTYYSLLTNLLHLYTPPYMLLALNYVHFVNNVSIIETAKLVKFASFSNFIYVQHTPFHTYIWLVWGERNCGRHFWVGGFVRFPEVLDAGEATSLVPFWDLKWDLETWKFCIFYDSFMGSALPLLEIRWQKGRQADKMYT